MNGWNVDGDVVPGPSRSTRGVPPQQATTQVWRNSMQGLLDVCSVGAEARRRGGERGWC